MKYLFTISFGLLFIAGQAQSPANKTASPQPIDIRVRIKDFKEGDAVLAYYFGNQRYVQDSAKIDADGNIRFKSDKKAPRGIYTIALPKDKAIEFVLVDTEPAFSMETDTLDPVGHMKIKGSKENECFYEYNRQMNELGKQMEKIQKAYKYAEANKNEDSVKIMQKKSAELDSIVKNFKRDFYKNKYPSAFFSKVLKAMDEPDIIPTDKLPKKANGDLDFEWNNRNYRHHYWDNFDFADNRMAHTPVFHNKMKFFLEKIINPHPDSISFAAIELIEKCRADSDLFKYSVFYCTYTYENSKIMGYDAIFVALVDKYYLNNQTWWLTDEQVKKIVERGQKLKYSLIGKTAVNINKLTDTNDVVRELQYVNADYTILVFWEPTCGHCKEEIPILKTYYDSLRAAGVKVEVYAIDAEHDISVWKKYIRENKLSWINVYGKDSKELAYVKYYYDVYSTPTIYILDKQKKIFAKRLDTTTLKRMLNMRIAEDKKAKSAPPKQ
jgi:thiol-disulfide isomerase/thioredoxin